MIRKTTAAALVLSAVPAALALSLFSATAQADDTPWGKVVSDDTPWGEVIGSDDTPWGRTIALPAPPREDDTPWDDDTPWG
jgi:hypothetical protein